MLKSLLNMGYLELYIQGSQYLETEAPIESW